VAVNGFYIITGMAPDLRAKVVEAIKAKGSVSVG
jgi:hypothetical protein